MFKYAWILLLVLGAGRLYANQEPAQGLITFPQFSIIGKWTYQLPGSACVETYEFSPDGHLRAASAKQVTDSIYFIANQHSEYAFYKLEHQVLHVNDEKDCSGETTQSGISAVHYVRFDEAGNSLVMCSDESAYLEQCFGPLYRSEL